MTFQFENPPNSSYSRYKPKFDLVHGREYLIETDQEFIESSWCNRNSHWSIYLFVGPKIDEPEHVMYHVKVIPRLHSFSSY